MAARNKSITKLPFDAYQQIPAEIFRRLARATPTTTTTTTTTATTATAATTARKTFRKFSSGRRDRFRQKIVEIGAILAIFEPFEVRKFRMPFFGEFSRSSQDLGESDYGLIKSREDRQNSLKSGMWILRLVI